MLTDLITELDNWGNIGRVATFWWRDDDLKEPTDQLKRLLDVAGDIPLALSVIPAAAKSTLTACLDAAPNVVVLQHGWAHSNHNITGGNSEYPAHRSEEDVSREVLAGRERLTSLFGRRALPVFVPPWHALDDRFLPLLDMNGLRAISLMGPRNQAKVGELLQVNPHVSPIIWTMPRSFGHVSSYVLDIVGHLASRRRGEVDDEEPTGLLTHHRMQNPASYAFIERLAAADLRPSGCAMA